MALSSEVQAVRVEKKVKECDFAVRSKVQVAEDKKIARVLSVKASVAVKDAECKDNAVEFHGNIYIEALYLSQENNFEKANCVVEYTSTCEGAYKQAFVDCKVIDTKYSIAEDALTLSFDNAVKAEVYGEFVENVTIPEIVDGLIIKQEPVSINLVSSRYNELFTLVNEIKIDESIDDVINVDTVASVKSVENRGDVLVVNIELARDITYICGDNEIKTEKRVDLVSQEFANRYVDGTSIQALVEVKSDKVSLEIDADNKTTNLSLVYIMECKTIGVVTQNVVLCTDAYSTTNDILTSKECFLVDEFVQNDKQSEKYNVSVNTKNEIDAVLAITNVELLIASKNVSKGNLILEGVITADVIYRDKNLKKVLSQKVSSPFVYEGSAFGSEVDVSAYAKMIGYTVKGTNAIDILYDCVISTNTYKTSNICFVSTINVGEPKDDEDAPISIYMRDGEDDFAVAKGLNITLEELEKYKNDNNFVTIFRQTK